MILTCDIITHTVALKWIHLGLLMGNAAKVGDIGTDHDGFRPTKVTAGSPDVFIDGLPAARVGDPLEPHDKPNHPPHPREIAAGSSSVFVNGKPLAFTGKGISCGGVIIGGGTVTVGDSGPGGSSSISSLLSNAKWIGFTMPAAFDYDGVKCIATLDDGSVVQGQFNQQNQVMFSSISGATCVKLEVESFEHEQIGQSLAEVLLGKIIG